MFQAGSSSKGRDFGAKHAEAVFTVQHTIEDMRKFSNDLRTRAVKAGRKRDSIRIFPLMVPIVGSTEEEAFVKYEELRQYVSYEGSVTILSGHLGIDLSMYDPDQYIEDMKTEGVQSVLNMYNRDSNKKWTIRDAVIHRGLGMDAVKFIGTPVQIADEMERWMNEGDIDGFNIAQVTTPGTFRDFIQYVIPELQQRGIYRTEYEASTLRENMFGKGNARLPDNHPGRSYRVLS